MYPKIGIVILNYNNFRDTVDCVNSIKNSSYANYKICIVDNFSSLEEQNKFRKQYASDPAVLLVLNSCNHGFSHGNNCGIKALQQLEYYDFFWILNNDTIINKNTLDFIAEYITIHPNLKIIGNTLLHYSNPSLVQGIGGKYNPWIGKTSHVFENHPYTTIHTANTIDCDYPMGASLFIANECVETVGYLPEDHFLFFEEIDYIKRAAQVYKSNFWSICTKATILHKEGASYKSEGKQEVKSELSDYHFAKNKLKITKKYFKYALPTIYLSFIFVSINRIRRKQYRRALFTLKLLVGLKNKNLEK